LYQWLDIEPPTVQSGTQAENKSRGFGNKKLHQLALALNKNAEPFLNKNPRIKRGFKKIYGLINDANVKYTPDEKMKQKLNALYAAKNQELAQYLCLIDNNLKLPKWLELK
jgi:hypothetical protein